MKALAFSAFLLLAAAAADRAEAHPHILVDAHVRLVFDQRGELTAIANSWDFDEAFSAYAIQGYDSKGDGEPTRQELQPLAQINMDALKEYHFFTTVTADGSQAALGAPTDYWDEFTNEKMTLHFTLPLKQPLAVNGRSITVDVYDDEYFAAVSFARDQPGAFAAEPPACQNILQRPQPLDAAMAAQLAKIPVTQHDLPAELHAATNKLVNAIVIHCGRAEEAK
ncbi:MAG: DUF1007 family protein [Hyphomicrobiales bacterium]|nr:DUF1007 family protein [Hyphomicrobiales bacterium]MBV8664525.1 DUF1007 family protein [Hyphomicrobiales bacterium]